MQQHGHTTPVDFRALFETSPNLYLVLDPGRTIVAVNDAYCQATKTERSSIVGRHLFEVFPDNPDDPTADGVRNLNASLTRVLETRSSHTMAIQKYDIRRSDAEGGGFERRYWACVNTPVFDANNNVGWLLHRAEDVTEMMQLRFEEEARRQLTLDQQEIIEQLRSTGDFLDAVIEYLPNMLFVKSIPDGRFLLINRSGEELLGFPRSAVLGKTDSDLFSPEQATSFAAADRIAYEAGKSQVAAEEAIITQNRGRRLLRTTRVPVRDHDSKTKYILGLSEDITDQKKVEQQLRQAMKMEAVGQLTGGIAHDFNNLLGVIIGNLDVATDQYELDPAVRECIEEAQDGALRGAELTRRLLAFSRNQPLQASVIDLNQGLPQMATMLRRTLGTQIVVQTAPADNLWHTLVDPAQMDEAILNLAINARDAMPGGGVLTIETANIHLDEDYAIINPTVAVGDYVQLSVSDTGTGMSADVIERCFEPFFTTKEVNKGSGLGLSMVYGFVRQSQGHIKIYSEVGHGTSFKIYLPRVKETAKLATKKPMVPADMASGDETILIVEDNEELRFVTVKQLSDLGYRVLEAENAKLALEMLTTNPEINLLYTDIIMPGGMTGTELAREAKQRFPQLKILLTSGYAPKAVSGGLHDLEGLPLLQKPVRKQELASKLRAVLDGS